MKTIETLENPILEYAWGSHTAIGELMGQPHPTPKPQAELWMGAHPKSPSRICYLGHWRSLLELLKEFPEDILGDAVADRYSHRLPFLFKILAAAKPLSIQAHPSRIQARQGFMRENQLEIPLDAFNRNYRDANHKPEILCALSPFWALCGFRKTDRVLQVLGDLEINSLRNEIRFLQDQPDHRGMKRFFQNIMESSPDQRRKIVKETLSAMERKRETSPELSWMRRLHQHYPGDIGVLAPVLLNLVELKPGQALFLPAGELHAYLEGVGIELMANSDNVIRGGLTSKHVDVKELLNVLSFRARDIEILVPHKLPTRELLYSTPTEEFSLASISLDGTRPFVSTRDRSVEILVCTKGDANIRSVPDGLVTHLPKGNSVLVPAAVAQYRLEGNATIYRATVPTA